MPGGNHQPKFIEKGLLWKVCMNAKRGRSKTDSFRLVGVHPDTGFAWLKRGRDGDESWDGLLVKFERVFERCVAHFSAQQLAMIEAAAQSQAPNTWQAAAWLLERRDPSHWGRRDHTVIETGDKPLVQVNQLIVSDPEALDSSRSLLSHLAAGRAALPVGDGSSSESAASGD